MEFSLWTLPAAFSLVFALATLFWSVNASQSAQANVLVYMMSAVALWAAAHLLRTLGTTVESKLFAQSLLFPGTFATAYYFALFSLVHLTEKKPGPLLLGIPFAVGFVLAAMVWLPLTRHLIFADLSIRDLEGFAALAVTTGPVFNVIFPVPFVFIVAGAAALLVCAYRVPPQRVRFVLYAIVGLAVLPTHVIMRQIWLDGITAVNFAPLTWTGFMVLLTLISWRFETQLQGLSHATVLRSLPDALFLTDVDGRIVYFNTEAQQRVRLPESEIIGEKAVTVFGVDLTRQEEGTQRDVLRTYAGKSYRQDIVCSTLRRSSGEPMMYAGILEDRTNVHDKLDSLRELHDQLLMQTGELEDINAAKRQFLSGASQDMQSPLEEIVREVDDLEASLTGREGNEESISFVRDMRSAALHLQSVVSHIMYFEKNGRESALQLSEVDIGELLDEMKRQFEPQAREKGLSLTSEGEIKRTIQADGQRIRQMLINLVSNAIKFTPEGGNVVLRVYAGSTLLFIEVEDSGIGVAEKDQRRIFQAFEQVDSSLARVSGGTGLGLPLVRRLARAHGGDVELVSTAGQGSTFRIYLPWERNPVEAATMTEAESHL